MLDIPDGFAIPKLHADSRSVDFDFNGVRYVRPQLVKSALPWCYKGVLHEYLECDGAHTSGHLPLTLRINSDGARLRDLQTYRNDAIVISQFSIGASRCAAHDRAATHRFVIRGDVDRAHAGLSAGHERVAAASVE